MISAELHKFLSMFIILHEGCGGVPWHLKKDKSAEWASASTSKANDFFFFKANDYFKKTLQKNNFTRGATGISVIWFKNIIQFLIQFIEFK